MAPSARTARARVELARRLGTQGVIESDPLTGTLRMVGRLDGYLTGRSARPAKAVAIGYVRSNLTAFGLTKADLKTFRLRQDYVDIAGVHHISWTQAKHGVPVFHNGLRANVTSDGRLVNITGSPVHAIRVGSAVPGITSDAAISAARVDGGATVAAAQSSDSASLVLFPTGHGARLAWKTFTWPNTQQLYHVGRGRAERVRAVPAEPDERRHRAPRPRGSSTRATWCPPARTWRTPSRSRWSTARA